MGPRFADQQVAGKHLGLLLSEMSALTRPLSGMIWVAVLGAGVKRGGYLCGQGGPACDICTKSHVTPHE